MYDPNHGRESFDSHTQTPWERDTGPTALQELKNHRKAVAIPNYRRSLVPADGSCIELGKEVAEGFLNLLGLATDMIEFGESGKFSVQVMLNIMPLGPENVHLCFGARGMLDISADGTGALTIEPAKMTMLKKYKDAVSLELSFTYWRSQAVDPGADRSKPEVWASVWGMKEKELSDLVRGVNLGVPQLSDAGSVAVSVSKAMAALEWADKASVASTCALYFVLSKEERLSQYLGLETLNLGYDDNGTGGGRPPLNFYDLIQQLISEGAFDEHDQIKGFPVQRYMFPNYKFSGRNIWCGQRQATPDLDAMLAAVDGVLEADNLFSANSVEYKTLRSVMEGKNPFGVRLLRDLDERPVLAADQDIPQGAPVLMFTGKRVKPQGDYVLEGENYIWQSRCAVPALSSLPSAQLEAMKKLHHGYEEGFPDKSWRLMEDAVLMADKTGGVLRWAAVSGLTGFKKNLGRVEIHVPNGPTLSVYFALKEIPKGEELVR